MLMLTRQVAAQLYHEIMWCAPNIMPHMFILEARLLHNKIEASHNKYAVMQ
jgi:hypothetical protein